MTDREALREAVARAMCDADFPRSDYWEGKTPADKWRMEKPHWLGAADAAIPLIGKACAEVAHSWQRFDALKLAAGEMTAQELRTSRAVTAGIKATILTLTGANTQ